MLFKKVIAGILCSALAAGLLAADPADPTDPVNPAGKALDLGTKADMVLGAPPSLGLNDAAVGAVGFSPVGNRMIYVSKESPVTWIRFRLADAIPAGTDAGRWILEVKPSFSIILDRVELWIPRTGAGYSAYRAGALLPQRPDEPPSRFYPFVLPSDVRTNEFCYLRLEGSMAVSVKVTVESPLAMARADTIYAASYGVIYGILIAMILYNLFIFLSLRDRAYLYYILYVASGLLWQFWVQGHAMALFGRPVGSQLSAVWIFVGLMIVWGAVFSCSFLSVRKNRPRFFPAFVAIAGLGLLVVAMGFCGFHETAFGLSHALGLILPALIIVTAVIGLRQGNSTARYFLVAWALLISGALAFALMGLGVLPVAFWTVNGVALGMAAESILLSMALGQRIRTLKLEKERLQESQERYIAISMTDELTGLNNKRRLMEALRSEVARARRSEAPLSLLFFDLDDFKSVNDSYGHSFGDDVLKSLAATVRESLREGDVACRFGGEEFVVIMPGTKRVDAILAAERLRKRFGGSPLSASSGEEVAVTISIGAVELGPGEEPKPLLDRADQAMYEAKRMGKNRTFAG
jgi:two-component system, sensor histidine kinase LadS